MKKRIDVLLVEQGHFDSREIAKENIRIVVTEASPTRFDRLDISRW